MRSRLIDSLGSVQCTALALGLVAGLATNAPSVNGTEHPEPTQIIGMGTLRDAAVSSDLQTIATVGSRGTALWELRTGQLSNQIPHGRDLLYQVAISEDGQRVLAIGTHTITVHPRNGSEPPVILPGGRGSGVEYEPTTDSLLIRQADAAQLWDARSGLLRETLTHPEIRAIHWAGHEHPIATAGSNQQAILWDPNTLQPRQVLQHPSPLFWVRLAPDGSRLATASNAQVFLWDPDSGTLLNTLEGDNSAVFSQDGRFVVTKGPSNEARYYDAATGVSPFQLVGNTERLESVGLSPEDSWVVGTGRRQIWLWDFLTGELAQTIEGTALDFSPGGITFVARQEDGSFELWETNPTGRIRDYSGHTNGKTKSQYTPDGRSFLVADGARIRLYQPDGQLGQTLLGHTAPILDFAFTPVPNELLSVDERGTLIRWDVTTEEIKQRVEFDRNTLAFVRSPGVGTYVVVDEAGTGQLWNAELNQTLSDFPESTGPMTAVAINANFLYAAHRDGTIQVRNPATGAFLTQYAVDGFIASLALDSQSTILFVGTALGPSYLLDPQDGTLLKTLETGPAWSAEFSPDDQSVLLSGASLWNLETGARVGTFQLSPQIGGGAALVRFSPDGRLIVGTGSVFDTTVHIWNAASGERLQILDRHEAPITSLSFGADNRTLLTSANDGLAILWPLASPAQATALQIRYVENQIILEWEQGTLEHTPRLGTPWTPRPEFQSPLRLRRPESQGFYRLTTP